MDAETSTLGIQAQTEGNPHFPCPLLAPPFSKKPRPQVFTGRSEVCRAYGTEKQFRGSRRGQAGDLGPTESRDLPCQAGSSTTASVMGPQQTFAYINEGPHIFFPTSQSHLSGSAISNLWESGGGGRDGQEAGECQPPPSWFMQA